MNKAYYTIDNSTNTLNVEIRNHLNQITHKYDLLISALSDYNCACMKNQRKKQNAEIIQVDSSVREKLTIYVVKIKLSLNRHGILEHHMYYNNGNDEIRSYNLINDNLIRRNIQWLFNYWHDVPIEYINIPQHLRANNGT